MKPNQNFYDITIRYVLVFLLGIVFGLTQMWIFLGIAVLLFITAVTAWCPIYEMLGIDHEQKEHS